MNLQLLRRHLAYRLRRLGWQGNAGLALLLVSLAYAGLVLLPAYRHGEQLAQQVGEAEARLKKAESEPASHQPTTPGEQLLAFYQAFPKGATVPDWLSEIYAIADNQKLPLDNGEYALTRSPSGRLDRFRIAFPVKASYPQIRKFIAAALATAPALALDGIYLKRDKVGDGVVDARIVFILYLEKGA
jgi:hypothetical protein